MQITSQVMGEQHPDCAGSLSNMAGLFFEMGDYAKAAESSGRTLSLTRRSLEQTAAVQSERQQLRMQEQARMQLDFHMSLTESAHLPASEAYAPLLIWKGSVSQRHARSARCGSRRANVPAPSRRGQRIWQQT